MCLFQSIECSAGDRFKRVHLTEPGNRVKLKQCGVDVIRKCIMELDFLGSEKK